MAKKMATVALLLLLLACEWPMSRVELCYRPQDVLSIERFYDRATDTYIQFVPTNARCEPLNFPQEPGVQFVRLQWR